MTDIVYSIKANRIRKSIMYGLELDEAENLVPSGNDDYHSLIIYPLDGLVIDSIWGRLSFDISCDEKMVYSVYLWGSNWKDDNIQTISDLESRDAIKIIGQNDILLYSLADRYLYIGIEIIGEGDFCINNIRVDKAGDTFMNTMPEIYQERDSFFHRYISIFSSIYNDFGEEIDKLPAILNLDTCPANALIEYGKWLGIDIDCDLKDEEIMRNLVKEAYSLNQLKGTKKAIARICEIFLGEEVVILEKNIMEYYQDEQNIKDFNELFGNNVYNVTILVNQKISEVLKSQLMFLIEQFAPIRARIQVINLKKDGELDYHSYLDMNAKLYEVRNGLLDDELALDKAIMLQE